MNITGVENKYEDIQSLFLEKMYLEKNENHNIIYKEKKIKKKDIITPNIEELELKYYEYQILHGIKIYNGLISDKKKEMKKNILLLKFITSKDIFTKLIPSVLSVQGGFNNILFNEELKMPFENIPKKEFSSILKIGSNFGEIYTFPNIYYPHSLDDIVKSIRALGENKVIIGCSCQPLLNIKNVSDLLNKLTESKDLYNHIKKYFTIEYLENSGIIKTRINRIIKNFNNIIRFKITDKELIQELYYTIDNIVKKDDIEKCNKYIDIIVSIITCFTKYAKNCKCWKKCQYTSIFLSSKKNTYKEKKESKRKKQGTGLYFNSQITFDIFNKTNQKVSKIKLFRNGTFQIPGVKFPDMRDIIDPLIVLRDYWNHTHPNNYTDISYILSNMRNYKCHLADPSLTILLNKLEDILYFEKDLPKYPVDNNIYYKILEKMNLSKKINEKIFNYMPYSFFTISEINNNPERYPGLLIKFNRPIPSKENKKITVKILSSGKINFDGGNSELEIYELYYWLQHIFIKYWNEIIYNPLLYPFEIVSSDSDEYESIYSD